MSVLSRNPFELLANADENDVPVVPKKEAKKEEPKKETKVVDNTRAKPQDARIKRDYPQRGGFRGVPAGRASAPRRADNSNFEESPEASRQERSGERGGFRGRGRGRGRGGKREFDRRSGSDRKDGPKKDVAGKGSWGEPTENPEEKKEGEPTPAEGETAEPKEGEEAAPVEEKEEEKVKTLDEYLAEKAAKKAALAQKAEIRKANEGADESQWKNAAVLKKEDVDENDDLAPFIFGAGKAEKSKTKKEKAQKVHLDIEQKFADERRGGRGGARGGRGGRGGNGGQRGGRGGKQAVNINDQSAFPTLGSK